MRTILFFFFAMIINHSLPAQDLSGDWHGMLSFQGVKLRLIFHIKQVGDGYTATMDSPDQNATGLPVQEVTFTSPDLVFKMPNLLLEYRGTFHSETGDITGTLLQGGVSIPLALQRQELEKPVVNRPQNPKPPFPYYLEEVTFPNAGAGIQLAGTLTLPSKEGNFPVVVLISGSGPQNRDEELLGHKPFWVIADYLTRQGIGVLRFDDRGVGKSTGNFQTATSEDFTTDVLAAVEYLKTRPEVNAKKIGLVGHSEGGLIAPMAAVRSKSVAYIVLLAGPGVPGTEIILRQNSLINRAEGQSEQTTATNEEFMKKAIELLRRESNVDSVKAQLRPLLKDVFKQTPETANLSEEAANQQIEVQLQQLTSPWFRYFFFYDPVTSLSKVKCPVLALNGGKDLQVDPKQNLPAIEAALKKAKNRDYTVKELPGLNHLFQHTETGKPSEYATIEETFAPEALAEIAAWIKARVRK